MNLMLFGAPGAGKGTQAKFLIEKYNIPQISTGDILRAAIVDKTDMGMEAKKFMDEGKLVPDSTIIGIIKDRLAESDCKDGFILDGFPRTLPQAEAVKNAGIKIDHVIEITVPDSEIIKRMSGRRVHLASGRTYHIEYNPPKKAGFDDMTNEPLVQRDDDKEETVKKRLDVYHQQTKPLVEYYQKLAKAGDSKAPKYHSVSGVGEISKITQDLIKAVDAK